jgi:hypothetical protein
VRGNGAGPAAAAAVGARGFDQLGGSITPEYASIAAADQERLIRARRLIVHVHRHLVAVIDGVIHDTHDSGGAGRRPVVGYWRAAT